MGFEELFETASGLSIAVEKKEISLDSALDDIRPALNERKGILFSSGFDYPGRHSRWDIGFIDPALEFKSFGRRFEFEALNDQGSFLLGPIAERLASEPQLEHFERRDTSLHGRVAPFPAFFTEEQRSRQPSIFSVLRAVMAVFASNHPEAAHFGLYGAFGYDLVLQFEELRLKHERSETRADCHLFLPLELTIVDRKRETAFDLQYAVRSTEGSSEQASSGGASYRNAAALSSEASDTVHCDHSEGEFARKVAEIIEGTRRGDYFEVVLSQEFSCAYDGKPSDLFEALCKVNPSPYMFLMNLGGEQLIGASPEIYARVSGRMYETCPIAGTVRRGDSPLEDAQKVKQLIGSEKDESELTMCTDVDRNDMARVCKPGSVRILGRRQLEFYSHLIHTVDHLAGELRDEFDALDAFQTHMWACTVTGAPKPAALQAIEDYENSPRGWYSGAIGMISFQGNLNTGILLRTAHLKEGTASIRAGATLLFDSDPEMEERETRTKAAAFLAALARANTKEAPAPKIIRPAKVSRRVLLVDCRDSFIHMLASYLRQLGAQVSTVRHGFPLEILDDIRPELVLLSPGPGVPTEFGVPDLVGTLLERNIAVFGVCLGHQGIGQHFGATLAQLPTPMHGKVSLARHSGSALFREVPEEFDVGRYHSLYLRHDSLPDTLACTAHCIRVDEAGNEEIIPMAVEHRSLAVAGVQFHPESLMTLQHSAGHSILRNVLENLVS